MQHSGCCHLGSSPNPAAKFQNSFFHQNTERRKAKPSPATIFLGQRRRGDGLARAEEGEKRSFARPERAKASEEGARNFLVGKYP